MSENEKKRRPRKPRKTLSETQLKHRLQSLNESESEDRDSTDPSKKKVFVKKKPPDKQPYYDSDEDETG